MNTNRIAVLLSAYNGEQYIEDQVRSILNQESIDSLTIIVRNDGSKDGTVDILQKLRKEQNNIEILDEQNIGFAASFLRLLEYAYNKGYDYYAFSDQDDYWLPEKLSIAIKALNGKKTLVCMHRVLLLQTKISNHAGM